MRPVLLVPKGLRSSLIAADADKQRSVLATEWSNERDPRAAGRAVKRILKLGRLRLRGPRGAQDEFTLAAIAQNLRRLAKLAAQPPPAANMCPG